MAFRIPAHVHDLIAKARSKNGRHEFSELVDRGLYALETIVPDIPLEQKGLQYIIDEQQNLLVGFRHIAIQPQRMNGKVHLICSRISLEMFFGAFRYLQSNNLSDWMESGAGMPNCEYFPTGSSEFLAFFEVFPEAYRKRNPRKHFDWWCDKENFSYRLENLGIEGWNVSIGEREEYYLNLWPSLIVPPIEGV